MLSWCKLGGFMRFLLSAILLTACQLKETVPRSADPGQDAAPCSIQAVPEGSILSCGTKSVLIPPDSKECSVEQGVDGAILTCGITKLFIPKSIQAGPQGPKGDQGNTGAKGDQGNTGTEGAKGDTGAQGQQGTKGDTGAQGQQGASSTCSVTADIGGTTITCGESHVFIPAPRDGAGLRLTWK